MKNILAVLLMFFVGTSVLFAQKRLNVKSAAKPQPVIFAVLNDGKTVEPIAVIDKGELQQASDGGDDEAKISAFVRTYYRPKTEYRLIFGGVDAGSITIKKNDPKAECSRNMAEVSVLSPKAKLKGLVMGLATNAPVKKGGGTRRLPTAAERSAVESSVRAEFIKQNVPAKSVEKLNYLNLTAIDVDYDGKPEFVGSYWAVVSPKERATLFIIAEQKNGKYVLGYTNFKKIAESEVMNEDITSIEKGIYQEVLLDATEYDGDNTAEIFTYIEGFEGSSFNAYSRRQGKWVRAFEGANYHCGY